MQQNRQTEFVSGHRCEGTGKAGTENEEMCFYSDFFRKDILWTRSIKSGIV